MADFGLILPKMWYLGFLISVLLNPKHVGPSYISSRLVSQFLSPWRTVQYHYDTHCDLMWCHVWDWIGADFEQNFIYRLLDLHYTQYKAYQTCSCVLQTHALIFFTWQNSPLPLRHPLWPNPRAYPGVIWGWFCSNFHSAATRAPIYSIQSIPDLLTHPLDTYVNYFHLRG